MWPWQVFLIVVICVALAVAVVAYVHRQRESAQADRWMAEAEWIEENNRPLAFSIQL